VLGRLLGLGDLDVAVGLLTMISESYEPMALESLRLLMALRSAAASPASV